MGIFTNVGVIRYPVISPGVTIERRGEKEREREEEKKMERRERFVSSNVSLCVYAPNFTSHLPCLHCFQAARGGINVETERGAARTVSELTLAAVTPHDVGKYSCRPTEGRTDTVMLIVEPG